MSQLNQLIQKLCPNRVEYKKIEEVCTTITNYTAVGSIAAIAKNVQATKYEYYRDKLLTFDSNTVKYVKIRDIATITRGGNFQKKDFVTQGVPCIHYGQIYTQYGISTEETIQCINEDTAKKSKMAVPNDIVMAVTSENIADICKCVAWLGKENIAVSGHTAIIHHNQNAKFLSYYFHTKMFYNQKVRLAHGVKVIDVKPNDLYNIIVPLPPIEVQREIVRILDTFTELIDKLNAELIARKKQYAYYRDKLLSFSDEVPRKFLYEVCKLTAGGDVPKDKFSKNCTNQYSIPIYSNGIKGKDLYGFTDKAKITTPCITISARGTIGYVSLRTEPFTPVVRLICAIPNDEVLVDYLKHILQILKFKIPKGGIPQLTVPMLSKYKIPVPSLEEQARIVAILDRFDTLCNDQEKGIPAEIALRQKQYEYYRDKLLSF